MILTIGIYVIFFAALIGIAVYDFRTRIIPNGAVVALAMLWIIWRVMLAGMARTLDGADFLSAFIEKAPVSGLSFADSMIGALVLGGGMLVLTVVFEVVTHRPAFGGGDIKLLAVIGLYLGLWGGLMCLGLACIVALPFAWLTERFLKKAVPAKAAAKESDAAPTMDIADAYVQAQRAHQEQADMRSQNEDGAQARSTGVADPDEEPVPFMKTAFAFGPALCIGAIATAAVWVLTDSIPNVL